jgi:transcriptional regulator with XRE-family HTH domain
MTRQGGWPATGFGERLRQLREGAGLTQQELAERAGCHYMTVSLLERGTQEPAWPLVLQLADVLAVPLEEFRSRGEKPRGEPPRRGRPPKQRAVANSPPAPAAPPPAEDLEGQAKAGPTVTKGAKSKRPRARRPKGK